MSLSLSSHPLILIAEHLATAVVKLSLRTTDHAITGLHHVGAALDKISYERKLLTHHLTGFRRRLWDHFLWRRNVRPGTAESYAEAVAFARLNEVDGHGRRGRTARRHTRGSQPRAVA